jgi:hypothetical protein
MPAASALLYGILNLGSIPVRYPLAKPVCFLAAPEQVNKISLANSPGIYKHL